MFTELAGFDPKTADDIRRAMGKKKLSVLEVYEPKFIEGCQEVGGLTANYAEDLWKDILGFADYCLAGNTKIFLPFRNKNIDNTIASIVKSQYDGDVISATLSDDSLIDDPLLLAQPVTQWHSKGIKDVYRYYFEDNSYVDCTPEHRFLSSNNAMVEIEKLYVQNKELKTIKV